MATHQRSAWLSRLEASFWSLQSLTWDDYLQLPEFQAEVQATARQLFARLEPGGRRVLDIGCGTGSHSLALATLGCQVVGVDFAPGMLRRAREKARQAPGSEVVFQAADFDRELPFAEHSFEGAIAVAVLQCATDPLPFLKDVRRVLTEGGLLLLVTVDSQSRAAAKLKLRTTPLKWAVRQIKALGNRSRRVRTYSRDQLASMLSASGFEVLEDGALTSTRRLVCRVSETQSAGRAPEVARPQ